MFRVPYLFIPAALLALLPAPGQAPKSPVVNPDRSVTFTISAPNAKDVRVGGEFDDKFNRPPGALMIQDEKGVWTYTTQALEPGIYYYGFNVDGLFTIDPSNPRYRPFIRQTPLNNVLEVRADSAFAWELAPDTPRGSVHFEEFRSVNLNRVANAYIYTPPSYGKDIIRTYPVLYLLHGASTGELGDTSREWMAAGYANRIMDNLIVAGKAREMIVVMADSQTPGASASLPLPASYELFEKYFIEEMMPFIESRYRIDANKASRWLAGLSRGGTQAFHTAFRHPDMFGALGAFSIGLPSGFPEAYPASIDAASLNNQLPLIFYTCGADDSDQGPNYERGAATLIQRGLQFETARYPGGHIWMVWRNSLAAFVTRLH